MVGYPWGERTITDARIEGTLVRGDVTVLRFSPEPHPGQSGSPLIDARGRLVGIAFAEDTVGGQGLAIPVSDVHAAVEAWRADGIPVG
jgi:S1-C subfamily serine protease